MLSYRLSRSLHARGTVGVVASVFLAKTSASRNASGSGENALSTRFAVKAPARIVLECSIYVLNMRTTRLLDALLPRTRQQVLATLLLHPEREWYVRALARQLDLQPSMVQSELAALAKAGIFQRRAEGKHVYFRADPACPILHELQGLLLKTSGLVDVLRDFLKPLESRILAAFVHGSVARAEELTTSDIDLVVIGQIGLVELAPIVSKIQERLARPVGITVYSSSEFSKKARDGHHFVRALLDREKIFVVGDAGGLEGLARAKPDRARTSDKERGRGATRHRHAKP